ncbi:MAG: RodZ domain-containing protein [bacterium]
MDSFFEELKKAREARNISLAEISTSTLIDIKMLEAIESGNVKILPQTYVRAFLREYSDIVGLDPQETMRKYDSWLAGNKTGTTGQQNTKNIIPSEVPKADKVGTKKRLPRSFNTLSPIVYKIIVVIAIFVLVDIVVWKLLHREAPSPVKETSFRDVVRDREKQLGGNDTTLTPASVAEQHTEEGPLTLVATTTDSVWLQIIVDDKPVVQHFLYPNTTFSWKGKKGFRFPAIGNPEHLKLTLQGKRLRVPATNKKVVRDLFYSLDSTHP